MKTKQLQTDKRQKRGRHRSIVRPFRIHEVADLYGVHPNTVRIWTESGALKSYRIGPRGDRRIPRDFAKGSRVEEKQMQTDKRQKKGSHTLLIRPLRVGEVADLLGVCKTTVRAWTESGVLKSYRKGPRGDRQIPSDAVDDFIKERGEA